MAACGLSSICTDPQKSVSSMCQTAVFLTKQASHTYVATGVVDVKNLPGIYMYMNSVAVCFNLRLILMCPSMVLLPLSANQYKSIRVLEGGVYHLLHEDGRVRWNVVRRNSSTCVYVEIQPVARGQQLASPCMGYQSHREERGNWH